MVLSLVMAERPPLLFIGALCHYGSLSADGAHSFLGSLLFTGTIFSLGSLSFIGTLRYHGWTTSRSLPVVGALAFHG
jgi:uncharacterized membrane protein YgdD (TMEM256/DUF423 family)